MSEPAPLSVPRPETGFLIVAHAPLASALRASALHVFPELAPDISAHDVPPNTDLEQGLPALREALLRLGEPGSRPVLVIADVFGATPCNIAQRLIQQTAAPGQFKLVTGASLPMLLRAMGYRHEPLDALVNRATTGGTQGVMHISLTAPQTQRQRPNARDSQDRHHQQ
jgi:PTS system ascorbate-specific IIA component